MSEHTKATERKKSRPTLPLLNCDSDRHIWAALWGMKQRGEIKDVVPDYEVIHAELKKLDLPAYDNKQISKSVLRLKSLGYIRSRDEFAGVGEQPPEVIQALFEAIA